MQVWRGITQVKVGKDLIEDIISGPLSASAGQKNLCICLLAVALRDWALVLQTLLFQSTVRWACGKGLVPPQPAVSENGPYIVQHNKTMNMVLYWGLTYRKLLKILFPPGNLLSQANDCKQRFNRLWLSLRMKQKPFACCMDPTAAVGTKAASPDHSCRWYQEAISCTARSKPYRSSAV